MIKVYSAIFILCFFFDAAAQNVGIGTVTPSARLEVKQPAKSVVKISSNSFADTSQLIFSNRNPEDLGTDMLITNHRESGLRFSSRSDLPLHNRDTILQVVPTGRVGIRTATPQYPLDVNGDMNIVGEIKTGGLSGQEGQYLRSNGNGTMAWANKERFKSFKVFRNDGLSSTTLTSTFTFPAGVTEVAVEIWGGGGKAVATGSGASGAYIYAVIPVASYTSLNTNVGAGGGCNACGASSLGFSSTVTLAGGGLTLTARGGYNSGYAASQGTFSATGTYLSNVNYFGIDGQSAKSAESFYENSPIGYVVFQRNAAGGDAPLRPGSGGRSGWKRTNWDGSNVITDSGFKGSEPGGGGGFPDADGGHGQIIVYW